MNFRISISTVLVTLMLSTANAAGETIYSWTDENGVRRISNMEPVDSSVKVKILELKPTANSEEARTQYTQPGTEPSAVQYETQISINGSDVIVPVTLSYKKKNVQARLLLDTGSTNITLHKDFARNLSIQNPRKGSIRVAGGKLLDAEAVILDSVTVGPHTQKNLVAGIIEHNGPDVAFDGLLGMNFLKNYQYTIDFENQLLRWNQ